ncbi:MAG: fructokinase [Clostridiales bacterium]|nr:MAG: fructokinase [Clostridiales bacterium]
MYDCIAIGEILVDFISDQKNDQGYPILNGNPGGGPPNFIVACQKLGLKTALIAKVGNDMFGHLLRETMANYGVDDESVVIDDQHFTTLAFVSLAEDGERTFSFARKQSADLMLDKSDLPLEKLRQTRALHFSSLSLVAEPAYAATLEAIRVARRAGAHIHFDPNYRPSLWQSSSAARSRIGEALAYCQILKISEYELAFLLDCEALEDVAEIERAANALLQRHPNIKLMHVTMGAAGVVVLTDKEHIYHAAQKVAVVDTTGAGDAYGAAALGKVLMLNKGLDLTSDDLLEIAQFASCAAGLSVQSYGGIPSSATLSEINTELNHK